jgi:hypothetical protein
MRNKAHAQSEEPLSAKSGEARLKLVRQSVRQKLHEHRIRLRDVRFGTCVSALIGS